MLAGHSRSCTVLALLGVLACGEGRRQQRVDAWPLEHVSLVLAAHEQLRLEAEHPSPGAQAVLHLWDVLAQSEVARSSSGVFSSSSTLHYENPSATPRSYQLLVRARSDRERGTVEIARDGRVWLQAARAGGTRVAMPSGPDIVHQVAALPGSPASAWLLALDAHGRLLALDQHSGPTRLPRLPGSANIDTLLLAADGGSPGALRIYANDASDRDHDGLGHKLERALGTCDSPSQAGCRQSPLAAYYKSVGTQDSDRDGISDADEVFGVSAPLLDLPRFGADPRHKDVFVEIDHHARLDDSGFSESELAEIAGLFRRGSATSLRNPDGLAGVHVHFDAGYAPRDPAHLALFGDFGGSGASSGSDYRAARKLDFSASRQGYFRYAFSTRSGRGQTTRDAFTVNRDLARVTIFAHELGHTLGLEHHGHDAWGRMNCKLNYLSIMNYLYQQYAEIGFSRRATPPLNPMQLQERGAAKRLNAKLLRDSPLQLDVRGTDVDWNRDGVISSEAVRADLLWGTYKSCGAAEYAATPLAERDVAPATPVLLSSRGELHAFWLDRGGRIRWRRGRPSDDAFTWSEPRAILGRSQLQAIAGLALPDESLALALVHADGSLELASLHVSPDNLEPLALSHLRDVRTEHAPSLSYGDVSERIYGVSRVLRLLWRAAGTSGEVYEASALPGTELAPRTIKKLVQADGLPLTAAGSPSVTTLPSGETCGIFSDAEDFLRFYCYDTAHDRWLDLSQRAFDVGLGPHTSGQVALGYHRYRSASGEPLLGDASRGALFVAFNDPPSSKAPHPEVPNYLVSEWLSARHGAREQISLRWRGLVSTEWTTLAPGTGLALAEDEARPGLAALMTVRDDAHHDNRLELLPYAAGEFDRALAGGDDFEVMERGICMGIRSQAECGDASTAAY